MTVVERVARAIRVINTSKSGGMLLEEFLGWGDDEDFVLIARAAIEAMREPSEKGLRDAYQMIGRNLGPASLHDIRLAWYFGIDAALNERAEGGVKNRHGFDAILVRHDPDTPREA